MKKWFYEAAPMLYLVALIVVMCAIAWCLQKVMNPQNFEAVFRLMIVMNVFLGGGGMVAVGIWGENRIKEMEEKKKG